jgi:hypothetical protein
MFASDDGKEESGLEYVIKLNKQELICMNDDESWHFFTNWKSQRE